MTSPVVQRDTPHEHARDRRDLSVLRMLENGHTYARIVAHVGVSYSSVSSMKKVLVDDPQ
jgi:uncharacterized protein YerC